MENVTPLVSALENGQSADSMCADAFRATYPASMMETCVVVSGIIYLTIASIIISISIQ